MRTEARSRAHEIWRIVRLHTVNPSIFFGVPWLILGGAWAVSMVIALIMRGAGASAEDLEGMRYSWAVLSPQWYLVVVGVQAIGLTFSFALGFGATRRDFWLGTSVMFLLVSVMFAVAIATLVQIEIATDGWWIGAHMFDALWYGQTNWFVDFYTTLRAAAARAVHRREHHDGVHALAHARHDDPALRRHRARARGGRRPHLQRELAGRVRVVRFASASWASSRSCS